MGVLAVSGLEPERAGAEALGDLRLRLRPDEAVLGRMAGAGGDLAHVVGLAPQLHLRPDRLHGRGDDSVLLLLQHVGDLLRELRRLPVPVVTCTQRLSDFLLLTGHGAFAPLLRTPLFSLLSARPALS